MTYSFTCHSDPSGSYKCGIIRFDNVTIMVDPSWNGLSFDRDKLIDFWGELVAQTDIILLSQPVADSLGAYALLYFHFLAHFKARIAVYATLPVANLGRVTTLDLYASQGLIGPVHSNVLDLSDIEEAFDHIITVKHSQILDLKSKFEGLTLIPHSSGYAPGGSIFCVTTYSDKIIYAPRWNHTKDSILNGAAVLGASGKPTPSLMRPSAIVTTTAQIGSSLPYKKRAARFKELLKEVLSKNGNAVIPTEIGGKFLDLLVLVHDMLYEQRRNRNQGDVPVLLVSYSRGRTLTYARSMLEWFSSSIVKTWEGRNNKSPFDLGSRMKIIAPEEVNKFPGPKICFVSKVDRLIATTVQGLCQLEKTTVILTEPISLNSESQDVLTSMYEKWAKKNKTDDRNSLDARPVSCSGSITLQTTRLETLKQQELKEFEARIENRRTEHSELLAKLKSEKAAGEGASNAGGVLNINDDEDEEDDVPDFITAVNRKANASISKPVQIPIDIQIQPDATVRQRMFPFHPGKVKRDDYGDVVDFTQFLPVGQLEEDKRNSSSAFDEEEDPYELEVTSSRPSKKRRGGGGSEKSKKEENFDDVSYLDTLNKPCRRVLNSIEATIRCFVAVVDLASLVDQRSMSVIWPSLKPHNILLIAPKKSQSPTAAKALSAKNVDVIDMDFNKPASFDTVIKSLDISVDPELDQNLKWQSISDGYTIAHVVGRLVKDVTQASDNTKQHRNKWVLKKLSNASKFHPKISLAIGDVKLAELKRKLTQTNHTAEFRGEGSLVVDNKVVVRKISDGETVVDGTPSEIFYEVKRLVADMLAKV